MDAITGHYVVTAADQETVQARMDGKLREFCFATSSLAYPARARSGAAR